MKNTITEKMKSFDEMINPIFEKHLKTILSINPSPKPAMHYCRG